MCGVRGDLSVHFIVECISNKMLLEKLSLGVPFVRRFEVMCQVANLA
jgi:hypothetical protein